LLRICQNGAVVHLRRLSADSLDDSRLAELLSATVNAGASVNFLAPMTPEEASAYWQTLRPQIESGERIVLVTDDLRACVHLLLATQPNGRHRAEVQKLLVHPEVRRQGLGRTLLAAAEEQAMQLGRTLLVLDSEKGSAGEALYEACGWVRIGEVPGFARGSDGRWTTSVYFYKALAQPKKTSASA